MIERPRLLPAVILGALSLIALKVLGWVHDAGGFHFQETAQIEQTQKAKPEYKGFVKIMAKAREPYMPQDPETTGSVPSGEKKPDPKKEAEEKEAEARRNDPRNRASVVNSGQRAPSEAEKALMERLGERRDEIETRARELEMREKLLETVEKKIEGKTDDLKQTEEKLAETKDKATGAGQGLKNLVVMYETMKPKDAARVFDRLNIDVLLSVVQNMNPRKMSDVLAAMSPEAAEKLTVALASRAGGGMREAAAPPPAAGVVGAELPALAPARAPQRN